MTEAAHDRLFSCACLIVQTACQSYSSSFGEMHVWLLADRNPPAGAALRLTG